MLTRSRQARIRAVLLLALASLQPAASGPVAAEERASGPEEIEALRREIQALRDQIRALQARFATLPPDAKEKPDPATGDALEKRLAELERELDRLGARAGEAPLPAPASVSPNVFNPTVTVFGNALHRLDDGEIAGDQGRLDDSFNVREVELDFRAAVDPFADGVLITSFESENPGEFEVGVEEAYVTIKRLPLRLLDEPPLGLKLRVGRFRAETGRMNRLHLHDLPQMTRPLAIEEFFGEEGYLGNGLSAQMFLPTPSDAASALELTAQILTGGGVAIADGPAHSAAYVGNLRWFRIFGAAHNLDMSLIVHSGRTDPDEKLGARTISADFLYKWKPLRRGESRSFLLGGQVLDARRDFLADIDTDGDGLPDATVKRRTSPLGYFVFSQHQLSRAAYLGVRWDDTGSIDDDSIRRRGVTGYLTWYASEFLRMRFAYEHRMSDLPGEDGRDSFLAELNFVFGAHPPEPFWVNR
jgi:hypothetical protein